MKSFYTMKKAANLKGGVEKKNDVPFFLHQNCCQTPKIAFSTSFFADCTSSWVRLKIHTRLFCWICLGKKLLCFGFPTRPAKKFEINSFCVSILIQGNCFTLEKFPPPLPLSHPIMWISSGIFRTSPSSTFWHEQICLQKWSKLPDFGQRGGKREQACEIFL